MTEEEAMQLAEIDLKDMPKVAAAFAKLETEIGGCSMKIVTWYVARMAAILLEQGYGGDRKDFDESFGDAIDRHLKLMNEDQQATFNKARQMN